MKTEQNARRIGSTIQANVTEEKKTQETSYKICKLYLKIYNLDNF